MSADNGESIALLSSVGQLLISALNAPASNPTFMVGACRCNVLALCGVLGLAVFNNHGLVVSVLASHARNGELAWSAELHIIRLRSNCNTLTINDSCLLS